MEAMEIINNEEIIEMIPEEVVTSCGPKGWKALAVGTLGVAVGYGIYRGVKWIKAKRQAKKEQDEVTIEDFEEIEVDE